MDEKELEKAQSFLTNWLQLEKLEISFEMSFPQYKILPDEVKLALSVLSRNGMKITVVLKSKEIKKTE